MAKELTNEQRTRDALNDKQAKELENTVLKDALKVSAWNSPIVTVTLDKPLCF